MLSEKLAIRDKQAKYSFKEQAEEIGVWDAT